MKRVNGALAGAAMALIASGRTAAESSLDIAPLVVSATRIAESSADLPASIDRIDGATLHAGQLQVNLSESLVTVPGVSAQNRQNYAQDLQLSVRGFGARSSFGVRGVRLYSDGIPGTMPDGQGQFSHFDLGSADHIEVLRGPFSALYGNSSGGVISVFTEDAAPGASFGGDAEYGTYNSQRYALKAAGTAESANYVLDASHFQTGGYRFHSDAERNIMNGKVRFASSSTSTLTLVGNAVQTPFVQDPLGLTRQQWAANPEQAGVGAVAYDTRKNLDQEQFGAVYENKFSAHDVLSSTLYTGHRATTQFQSIPQATEQATPLHPGGVIDLSRAFWGIDTHLSDQRGLGDTTLRVVGGVSYDDLEEVRQGYLNFVGSELGVEGALRRSEANHVYDLDQYFQVEWDDGSRWRMLGGVRHSAVDVSSHDHLAGGGEPRSAVRFGAVDPVGGITFRASPRVNVYGSYGKGFETPTLNDLAYRSTDGHLPGLNFALRPARSDNYEVGLKAGTVALRVNLAAFYIKTRDELAVLANSNGRTVNQNISETQRRGAELAMDARWSPNLTGRVAYTYLRAVVAQAYNACAGVPCRPANSVLVAAGTYLPAIPMNALYAGVTWRYAPWGFLTTVETVGRAHIYTDDRNSDAAASYWVANVRAGFDQDSAHFRFSEFIRLDNVADRAYVGSVIVNESNRRFFEAAPGRAAYLMFNAAWRSE